MGELYRAQILLEAEQHEALAALAKAQGRSISDLTREIIARYLTEQEGSRHRSELDALERARELRASMREQRGGKPLGIDVTHLIHEMREERDEQVIRGDC